MSGVREQKPMLSSGRLRANNDDDAWFYFHAEFHYNRFGLFNGEKVTDLERVQNNHNSKLNFSFISAICVTRCVLSTFLHVLISSKVLAASRLGPVLAHTKRD